MVLHKGLSFTTVVNSNEGEKLTRKTSKKSSSFQTQISFAQSFPPLMNSLTAHMSFGDGSQNIHKNDLVAPNAST